MAVLETILESFANPSVAKTTIVAVLGMACLLSLYEFIVYRVVSHRAFYNRAFNISIAMLSIFISTIILCLQSNVVITLGTIGALTILRFRTTVKDPVDMMYLLWSVHTGIVCGCQLYPVAVFASVVATIFLLVLENFAFSSKPYVIVFHCADGDTLQKVLAMVKETTKAHRVKSRNYTAKGIDAVVEAKCKDVDAVAAKLKELNIEKFSIIHYDNEDVM